MEIPPTVITLSETADSTLLPNRKPIWIGYGAMLAAAIGLFFVINHFGTQLAAPAGAVAGSAASAAPAAGGSHPVVAVLIALGAVLVVGRILAPVVRLLGQPAVIGEVIAGILLGPSFLGRYWPAAYAAILPPSVAPHLGMIAQIGVILYMFLVGLELNPELLRKRAHATVAISHASIVAPFVMGMGLALYLYPRLSTSDVRFTSFALFMGVAMSITAFPILARILTDRGLHKSPLGVIALGCAAADDVTAWCLLAFVVGVAQSKLADAFLVLGYTVAYIGIMYLVARPLATRFFRKFEEADITPNLVAVVLTLLFASALITEWIGIHAVFGAFLLGAIIPHDCAVARVITTRFVDLVSILLLPAFFAFTGMRTELSLVSGWSQWLLCMLIIFVATAGKFGGTLAAARTTGLGWRDAMSLGLLMNTRGLMELIVLNIGLDLGVISPTLFAMMVVMALATTVVAAPFLPRLSHS
jgi:Kef-type K+ transport system membrane component KefB